MKESKYNLFNKIIYNNTMKQNKFKIKKLYETLVNLRNARNALDEMIFMLDDTTDELDKIKEYLNDLNHMIDRLDVEYRVEKYIKKDNV